MDIKAKIEEIVKKLQSDKTLLASFQSEPIKTVEKLLDIDLPDEMIEKVVEGVKAQDQGGRRKGYSGRREGPVWQIRRSCAPSLLLG